ncbi:Vps53-like protein [Lipomyces kononenkoae]|uniref:Vps53-like protein n=1 Tax=Lipomyces kononenkoae TaxID=34357 RepID=A0ACC3TB17_LIPKO
MATEDTKTREENVGSLTTSADQNGFSNKSTGSAILDPLDQAEYDHLPHLVEIFSKPESIAAVPRVKDYLDVYSCALDAKMEELLAAQQAAAPSVMRVARAHKELATIFSHIESVRERAVVAEEVITGMTADIRKLDETKRNLTMSMTMLKRLQMLTTAYEQLTIFAKNRHYKDAAQLLDAVIELGGHFKSYRSIAQIATLSRNVAELQRAIGEQVCEDFEAAIDGRRPEYLAERSSELLEGCMVMDALGDSYRHRLTTWYCNVQLREYRNIFRGSEEAGSLDNIQRRYSYLKRMLKTLEPQIDKLFPQHWKVAESLCRSFCEITRDDYKVILSRSGKTLNVDLLLKALNETMEFEQFLERRFSSVRTSVDSDMGDKSTLIFGRAISEAFEPYLGLWVESQDKKLSALVTQYSNQMILPPSAEDETPQQVFPSSVDLFLFYRQVLAQSAKISTGEQLLNLSRTFAKYLQQYADRVLASRIIDKVTAEQEVQTTCLIISTANYCNTTAEQLEQRIADVIDEEFKAQVDFEKEKDAFLSVASSAVQSLVRKMENDCKPAWREMLNTNWGKLYSVGDQSAYVTELIKTIEGDVKEVLTYLHKDVYIRSFCDRVVESTINTYLPQISKCKPLTEICTEQMLLDTYVLKKSLLRLPVIMSPPDSQVSTTYINLVNRVTAPLESVLKAILTGQSADLPDNLKVYLPTSNIVQRALPEKFRWSS